MPRPAPWRLDPAAYPSSQTIQTRFQDLDTMGHLNNVAFAALFESARIKFNHAFGRQARPGDPFRAMVAYNGINYLAEGGYPADVVIHTGISRIGGRSWDILALMMQDGRPIATCDSTIVMAATSGETLPEDFRAAIEAMRVRGEAG
jgi:acyl-CoA thioester hydrolase